MHNKTPADSIAVIKLHYHQQRRELDVTFNKGETASFTAEFLRVHSPSAEVRGHGNAKLVSNKKQVAISKLQPVGHYAIKLLFDDGHDTGIYSWLYLKNLADKQATLWQQYLAKLTAANANRDSLIAVNIKF